jgi:hypothetical protein
MRISLDFNYPLEVLHKEEIKLMKRVQRIVDSEYKHIIEDKIRSIRVIINICKQAEAANIDLSRAE